MRVYVAEDVGVQYYLTESDEAYIDHKAFNFPDEDFADFAAVKEAWDEWQNRLHELYRNGKKVVAE